MSENKYKGTSYTFWQLLKDHVVEIPIIQRDYAQGRIDKQEIRDNFLNALFKSLETNSQIKLDFIYGSNEDGAFQPLDGQQRLTTLFLLHWYAMQKSDVHLVENISILKKFSYETRISSREFCQALVSRKIAIDSNVKALSDVIVDSSWFFLSWKKDPTIDAMLRTIDDIHRRFYSVNDLWTKLTQYNSLFSFYHVELKDIGLTDDLYIKMNARGKLLSPFENFKASFQKYINDLNWESDVEFQKTFASKIDTVWTDLFWGHRKDNIIDEAFIRFISTIAMIRQSLERSDDRINILSRLQENPSQVKSENFSVVGFKYLCECFDVYSKINISEWDMSLNFPLWQHEPKSDIFSAVVYEDNLSSSQRNSASYTTKVLFYAQTEYLRTVSNFENKSFEDWMRVIRNIVSRGDVTKNGDRPAIIRSPATFDGVINLINELSEGCENIYLYLSNKDQMRSSFAKEQVEEEKIKAKIIIANNKARDVIFSTENCNLLQGRIEFALSCINFDGDITNFDVAALQEVQKILHQYFNDENGLNNDLRRALLTIPDENGNYNFYGYWWSFWNVVSANKRCLIDKYRELEYYIYGNYKNRDSYRKYLSRLILMLRLQTLEQISDQFTPPSTMENWKVRLIKDKSLLDTKSRSNYIAIPEDDSACYLLKSMRPRDLEGCEKIE